MTKEVKVIRDENLLKLRQAGFINDTTESELAFKLGFEKAFSLTDVSQQRQLLDALACTMEFDTKNGTYQEDIDYFLEAHKSF